MKKLLAIVGSLLLLTGCNIKPYAQLSSHKEQIATDHPQFLSFEADGEMNDIGVFQGESGSEIKIQYGGTYLVLFSPQVTTIDRAKSGCFDAWLVVGNSDVKDSGVRECFNADHPGNLKHGMGMHGGMHGMPNKTSPTTDVLVGQVVIALNPGDKIKVAFTGYNTKTFSAPASKMSPSIPASIFSITRIS